MKKIILGLFAMVFLLTGCDSGYERDDTQGEIIEISLSDMKTMMEEGKEFVVAFTQSSCGYCMEFHAMFNEYAKDHHVVIYEVPLEKEEASPRENRALIQTYFPAFDTTPGIFYAKDKTCVDQISNTNITEELFDNWIQKHELDKKKSEK